MLRQTSCYNAHPERVRDELFLANDFFDPHDLVQVKYEMVRKVQKEGWSVKKSASVFGFSRPCFYQTQAALNAGGLSNLLHSKPGPRHAHKLNDDMVAFLMKQRAENYVSTQELAQRLLEKFGLKVHIRSIERALLRAKKNSRNANAAREYP